MQRTGTSLAALAQQVRRSVAPIADTDQRIDPFGRTMVGEICSVPSSPTQSDPPRAAGASDDPPRRTVRARPNAAEKPSEPPPAEAQLDALFDQLPALPRSTHAVIRLASRDAEPGELAQVVELDPVLTLSLMRLAGSAMFRTRRPPASVREAIVRLGVGRSSSFVLTVALRGVAQRDGTREHEAGFNHAVATAIASRRAAESLGADPELAYLAGLVHDVGLLVRGTGPGGIADHALVAQHAAVRWNLPVEVAAAVGRHHDPPSLDDRLHAALVVGDTVALALSGDPELAERAKVLLEQLASVLDDEIAPASLLARTELELEILQSAIGG